jgi:uncharacterized ferritin-like protein (DUF455 family)
MELAVRSLIEFPQAPTQLRAELLDICLSESVHLQKCLESLEHLGFAWGHWPVHIALWLSVSPQDSLLDRLLIVHRYLEGSGLDSGDTLLRRLWGLAEGPLHKIVKLIVKEEIGHVEFGSRWYRDICRLEKLDPQDDFVSRMEKIRFKVPKRVEPISRKLRSAAGFSEFELDFLEDFRLSQMARPVAKTKFDQHVWNQKYLEEFIPLEKAPLTLG